MANWGEDFQWYPNSNNEDDNVNSNKSTEACEIPQPSAFSTDMVFNSRKDLIGWVRNMGYSLGFVIVIKRSNDYKVEFQCDCSGKHKSNKISSKHTGTRKTNCPFHLVGNHLGDDCWTLTVKCEAHNHDFALYIEGHAYARRLSQTEAQLVEDLSANNVKPRDILSTIKKQYPDNVSTKKTIYNQCQKLRLKKNAGRTPMQVVMSFLQEEGYVFYDRANDSTNELEDLFFAHPRSLEIWRAFPHVLLMDVTYKTTMFETPLLQIVGVTSTNKTFCVAFVFMHKEKISNYTWALKCLLSLMDECLHPRVIVTDRDLALMRACNNVFPGAKRLLCRWHIYQSIMRNCRPTITSNDVWGSFYNAWMAIIASESDETYLSNFAQLEAVLLSYPESDETYLSNFAQLEAVLLSYPGVFAYLNDTWLTPYKEMFVSAWTDKFLHFGNRTSNRVESQHSKLKSYLNSAQSSLPTFMNKINQVIQSQDTEIKASIQQSRSITKHLHRKPHFQQLYGFVSLYALDILLQEYQHAQSVGLFSGNCNCLLRTCYGLPCAHEQMLYFNKGLPIPIDSIDVFWTKLDLSVCQTLPDDNIGCENEVQMFTEQFNKQSRAGKFSFLRKITEIFTPSKTSVREPVVNKTTRGRPSLKDKNLRKTHVDPSVAAHVDPSFSAHGDPSFSAYVDPSFSAHVDPSFTAEKPFRRSCSNASSFVDLNEMSYQEPPRHSSFMGKNYNVHPYINQFPKMFHPYITHVHDVKGDGNCGFRAIAVWLGLHEDAWPTIRSNLMEELDTHKAEYWEAFGGQHWTIVYNTLNFFQSDRGAPAEHWMTMPEIGVLIASRYNVILHVISMAGSLTYLPLRSTPPAWYQHVAFTIGYVNGNHYVKLDMAEGYPFPRITQHFYHYRYPCAAGWATPYSDRIQKYERLLRVNCTTDNVILE